MKIFAITTRGLESLSAEEMAEIPHLTIRQTVYRRVVAEYAGPLSLLLNLRTVDDIYLDLATWTGILRTRDSLARMNEASARLNLYRAADELTRLQPIPENPVFSVTTSFVGKRNYSADEIKQAVAAGITNRLSWKYQENDQPNALNLRVFIEHDQAYVGLRLSNYPLHQRPYKQAHVFGSTKPSVAAAMVRLAQATPRAVVLDPCCGAGTILIEAALMGAAVLGGDIDPKATAASRENLRQAGINAEVQDWDARSLPLPDQSVERIITNLPWGRQVSVDNNLEKVYQAICAEMHRVLVPSGRAVLLANDPQFVQMPGMQLQTQLEISLFGQTPKIMVFQGND